MGDLAEVYERTQASLAEFVSNLDENELDMKVPATPDWTIRDVIAHLTGDLVCVAAGDFPREFFQAMGSSSGIETLNSWTDKQVAERRGRALEDLLTEWKDALPAITAMMREETPWPEATMAFIGHILTTDIAIHQQDIYGALAVERDRDAPQVRIGLATYIGGITLRTQMMGLPPLRLVMENKETQSGPGDPAATVQSTRFEFFRALSGRRNPDQIRSFDWDGDPDPFLPLFYPYGIREEALVE